MDCKAGCLDDKGNFVNHRWVVTLYSFALVMLCVGPAMADSISLAAAYARAEALSGIQGWQKVRNAMVEPRWIGERDEFWYRRDTTEGSNFVLVDAATGKKRPAGRRHCIAFPRIQLRSEG